MSSYSSGSRSRANADEIMVTAIALTAGRTLAVAVETAAVSARTVSRRLADPAFEARIHAVRGEKGRAGLWTPNQRPE